MVRRSEIEFIVARLTPARTLAIDTETTGLRVWQQDHLFSIIIADCESQYYFNFQNYPGLDPDLLLHAGDLPWLQKLFDDKERTFFMHNSKFDLAALHKIGLTIKGKVQDTLVMARLAYNEHMNYSLAECAKRIGLEKDDAVESYISDEHMWEWEDIPGKKVRGKKKFFDRVPIDIIVPYGKRDAQVTFQLGLHLQRDLLLRPKTNDLLKNEFELTKTCFEMEKVGIKIDRSYCEKAYLFEKGSCERAKERFTELCGLPFVDSNKALSESFKKMGQTPGKTDKGNPSFTEEVLKTLNHPLAEAVRDYREAYKKASTYYQSFLYYADDQDTIHANIRQAGTTTGRFSYSDPNLQNIPKEEGEATFKVRRAFVPRETFCFVEFDYKAFEYRLMAEYAEEMELIKQINQGVDVHEATAQMMGVDRRTAKTLNFMLLYGGGAQKLADALGLELEAAKQLKLKYFAALPNVKSFISRVTKTAEERGFIFNWLGRRCYFPDPNFAYKAPNALIQGGTAEIIKTAMNRIQKRMTDFPIKSRMLVQVHDSLLFEIHKDELEAVWPIKHELENAYPSKHLKMEVSISHSWKSWADLIDGEPR